MTDGYTYGTDEVAPSPLGRDDLDRLLAAAGITDEVLPDLRRAGEVLADQAAQMVSDWRAMLGEHEHLRLLAAHPDGSANPEYAAASKPRFDRWVVDACTRPFDQDWLDYQHEIGRRHTTLGKNRTDHADSAPYVPMRYLLAFTGHVVATSRGYLARSGRPVEEVDAMHAAFTRAVLLHVTVWTRAYPAAEW